METQSQGPVVNATPTARKSHVLAIAIPCITLCIGIISAYAYSAPIRTAQDIKIKDLQTKITETEKQIASLNQEIEILKNPPKPPVTFDLLAPKGGENLCRGKEFTIKWNGSEAYEQASVMIKGPRTTSIIGDFPITWNETKTPYAGEVVWKVGYAGGEYAGQREYSIPDGALYKAYIEAKGPGQATKTIESNPFTITTCEG